MHHQKETLLGKFFSTLIWVWAGWFLIQSTPGLAQSLKILDTREEIFSPRQEECTLFDPCTLDQAAMKVQNYRQAIGGGFNLGTRAAFSLRTNNLESLEDYVFVQFIKGCQYYSSHTQAEGLKKGKAVGVRSFEEGISFFYSDWRVDSLDRDPVYNSSDVRDDRVKSRHDLYRWTTGSNFFSKRGMKLLLEDRPESDPEIFVLDHPGSVVGEVLPEKTIWVPPYREVRGDKWHEVSGHHKVVPALAQNISLDFKMCVYPTWTIPLSSDPMETDFGKPLHCFSWDSKWVYDFKQGKHIQGGEIDPHCLNPLNDQRIHPPQS